MRSVVIGTLALAGATFAAPATAQSVWVGGSGFSFGFGAGPAYAYDPYYEPYWGGPVVHYRPRYRYGYGDEHRRYVSGPRIGFGFGYSPGDAYAYSPDYAYAYEPSFGYAPRYRSGFYAHASAPRQVQRHRHHTRVGTRARVRAAAVAQPAPRAGFDAYARVDAGPGYAYVRQANASGQCWVSTDNTRGFGYWGRCATPNVDLDAATLGQARRNVSRIPPHR